MKKKSSAVTGLVFSVVVIFCLYLVGAAFLHTDYTLWTYDLPAPLQLVIYYLYWPIFG